VALEVLFAWAVLYWPPMQRVLATGPVPPAIFALAWLGAPLLFGLDYLRKRMQHRHA
jgi:sodium/potassium-transporting ATPase subunit alpha